MRRRRSWLIDEGEPVSPQETKWWATEREEHGFWEFETAQNAPSAQRVHPTAAGNEDKDKDKKKRTGTILMWAGIGLAVVGAGVGGYLLWRRKR